MNFEQAEKRKEKDNTTIEIGQRENQMSKRFSGSTKELALAFMVLTAGCAEVPSLRDIKPVFEQQTIEEAEQKPVKKIKNITNERMRSAENLRSQKEKYEILFVSPEVEEVMNKLKVRLGNNGILLPDNQEIRFDQEINGVTTKRVIFSVSYLKNKPILTIRCENSDGSVDIATIDDKEWGRVEFKIETTANN